MPMKTNCKDCTKRHVGCHAHCEVYLSNKAEWDARRNIVRNAKQVERIADTLASERSKHRDKSKYKRLSSNLKWSGV